MNILNILGGTGVSTSASSNNLTINVDDDLAALSGLSGTGIVVRTGSSTYAERTITGGTGITVTNGDGVSGNPDVALTSPVVETLGGTNQTTFTTGDILYSDGANSLEKLAIGTAAQVLTVTGGVPTWETVAAAAVEFPDNTFRIYDDGDSNSKIAFSADNLSGGVRTITMPDQDIDLTPTTGDFQASDADLTAISALSSTGLVARTGVATYAERTITGGTGITVTNGDGVSGNPDVALTSPVVETLGGTNQTTFTTGDILYSDGTNSLEKLAIGSSSQVLTVSGGVPTWAAAATSGGGLTFLSSATASTSASLDFTSSIDSTYNVYMFVLENVLPDSSNKDLDILFSNDGGSSYETTSYKGKSYVITSTGGSYESTISSVFISFGQDSSADDLLNGIVYLYNPSVSNLTYMTGQSFYNGSDIIVGGGFRNVSEVVDAVRFSYSSGNIASGTISMYGMTTPS